MIAKYGTREHRGALKDSLETAVYISFYDFIKRLKDYKFYSFDERVNQVMFLIKDFTNVKKPAWLFIEITEEKK